MIFWNTKYCNNDLNLDFSSGVINTISGKDSIVNLAVYEDNITVEWDKFQR